MRKCYTATVSSTWLIVGSKWDNGVFSDHTRDDVRTQSSKYSSLYYRTKTTSRSDFQGCGHGACTHYEQS